VSTQFPMIQSVGVEEKTRSTIITKPNLLEIVFIQFAIYKNVR
jgi:hypothetical protein